MSLLRQRGIAVLTLLLSAALSGGSVQAQRFCGQSSAFRHLETEQPAAYAALRTRHAAIADSFATLRAATRAKTAATNPIPVVFHILIDSVRYITMGRDTGVKRRVASQLRVLNADYNRGNADSSRIPAAFKSLYTNVGFQFGLANRTTANTISPGIEVKIVKTNPSYNDINLSYNAKHESPTGLDAWDPTRYLNVWVVRLTPSGGAGTILGVTTPYQFLGLSFGGHTAAFDELGVVINYQAFGSREFPLQNFFGSFDRGRTLTHEIGHFFELYHTWGDDDNSVAAGYCPGEKVGGNLVGYDDDIADTPPQAARTYCDFLNHNGTLCPTFPLTDKCSPSSPGIMFMNYMDYVDDTAMQMFTVGQSVQMQLSLLSEEPELIQHPELVGVNDVFNIPGTVSVAPNPATGRATLSMEQPAAFRGAVVLNMMGQTVANITRQPGVKTYPIDLSAAPRGIYFVRCAFDGGSVTQKLILE